MVKVKHEDELQDLKSKLLERQDKVDEQIHRLEQMSSLPTELEALRERCASLQEAADAAQARLDEAESDGAKQRDANTELLERLLAQQRRSFEEETARLMAELTAAEERIHALSAAPPPPPLPIASAPAAAKPKPAEKEKKSPKQHHKTSVLGNIDLDESPVSMVNNPVAPAPALEPEPCAPTLKNQTLQTLTSALVTLFRLLFSSALLHQPPAHPRHTSGKPPAQGADPIKDQIAAALRSNSTRVIDLFREWDTDGDGEVSRAEFHKAMPLLGLDVPKKVRGAPHGFPHATLTTYPP